MTRASAKKGRAARSQIAGTHAGIPKNTRPTPNRWQSRAGVGLSRWILARSWFRDYFLAAPVVFVARALVDGLAFLAAFFFGERLAAAFGAPVVFFFDFVAFFVAISKNLLK